MVGKSLSLMCKLSAAAFQISPKSGNPAGSPLTYCTLQDASASVFSPYLMEIQGIITAGKLVFYTRIDTLREVVTNHSAMRKKCHSRTRCPESRRQVVIVGCLDRRLFLGSLAPASLHLPTPVDTRGSLRKLKRKMMSVLLLRSTQIRGTRVVGRFDACRRMDDVLDRT